MQGVTSIGRGAWCYKLPINKLFLSSFDIYHSCYLGY